MKKRFNTTGSCNPALHYMVDTSKKLAQIEEYIEEGLYFTINRARQFGKTTTMKALFRNLSDRYVVISISFEIGDTIFDSVEGFCEGLDFKIANAAGMSTEQIDFWQNEHKSSSFEGLSYKISAFCKSQSKPVLLLIDEVDKSTDNQLFLNFLGLLRNKFLDRDMKGMNSTFHSVVLAGVYDVKNLKLKLRPDEERKYNSPWNIATDFDVDMTFHPDEIITMLNEYEEDYKTGMDKVFISNEIYKYTSGYPFLVSKICELIDKKLGKDWSENGVQEAVKIIENDDESTLINSLTKNIENDADLKKLLKAIMLEDFTIEFNANVPLIKKCKLYSILKAGANNKSVVHNIVFERVLYNYFITEEKLKRMMSDETKSVYIQNGRLNMPLVIERFQALMRNERRKADDNFLERQGRLLFLCFLKPIINGSGFYYVEPETRNGGRIDLVVSYAGEEFVIELKIWRGEKYEVEGKVQLAEYLNTRNLQEGFLVTFSFLKNKTVQEEPEWIEHDGKRIYEAII